MRNIKEVCLAGLGGICVVLFIILYFNAISAVKKE